MNTIAEKWQDYKTKCIPETAGETQLKETQRAFYAGAMAVLSIGYSVGSEEISEDAGIMIFQGLHDEARLFGAQVLKGEA